MKVNKLNLKILLSIASILKLFYSNVIIFNQVNSAGQTIAIGIKFTKYDPVGNYTYINFKGKRILTSVYGKNF